MTIRAAPGQPRYWPTTRLLGRAPSRLILVDHVAAGNPGYNTSKAGLATFLEALRNRLTRRGVHVLTVKPGFMQTDTLKAAQGATPFTIPPEKAAEDIWKAIRKQKQVIYTASIWRWIMLAIQHTPSFIFRK